MSILLGQRWSWWPCSHTVGHTGEDGLRDHSGLVGFHMSRPQPFPLLALSAVELGWAVEEAPSGHSRLCPTPMALGSQMCPVLGAASGLLAMKHNMERITIISLEHDNSPS